MGKVPNQRLLKWEENGYWYTIERGPNGEGYSILGFWDENTGKTFKPQFSFPFSQEEVAKEFEKQGKQWSYE